MDWGLQQFCQKIVAGRLRCFNPCFDGLGTSTCQTCSFASFPLRRFNPCFDGLGTSTARQFWDDSHVNLVSILVLMDWGLQQSSRNSLVDMVRMFQSLFWWIGDFNDTKLECDTRWFMFQSLFWWIGDFNRGFILYTLMIGKVSILVLMDWGLQRSCNATMDLWPTWVSILVLMDWGLQLPNY